MVGLLCLIRFLRSAGLSSGGASSRETAPSGGGEAKAAANALQFNIAPWATTSPSDEIAHFLRPPLPLFPKSSLWWSGGLVGLVEEADGG